MYRFHRTPFETLIENILRATESQGARFTFPIVASIAGQKPELLRRIRGFGMELAVHGYMHLRYSMISPEAQRLDLEKAFSTFRRLNLEASGFRAPYDDYTDVIIRTLEKYAVLWDGGIGYRAEHRDKTDFFRVMIGDKPSSYTCIPLSILSDDMMIDHYHLSPREISKILRRALESVRAKKALVMFDLHPIRIGQPKFVKILEEVVRYGIERGGWFPTVTEAVTYRSKHDEWKDGAEFCCLLTGDIDNFTFWDYLKRLT